MFFTRSSDHNQLIIEIVYPFTGLSLFASSSHFSTLCFLHLCFLFLDFTYVIPCSIYPSLPGLLQWAYCPPGPSYCLKHQDFLLFTANYYSIVHISQKFSISLFIDGCLGCSHTFTKVNGAAWTWGCTYLFKFLEYLDYKSTANLWLMIIFFHLEAVFSFLLMVSL